MNVDSGDVLSTGKAVRQEGVVKNDSALAWAVHGD
jgi:hypothetical protein